MPLVGGKTDDSDAKTSRGRRGRRAPVAAGGGLFPRCANPRCATGWIHLWRNRRVPGFEGQWACSPGCMEELVAAAVRREMEGGTVPAPYPHRLPMGLLLVEQGRITPTQLHAALEEQKRAAEQGGETHRLGEWLLKSGVLSEPALTRALSAQWNCPVFSLEAFQPSDMSAVLPHFLSEVFGALPVRAPAGKLLYLAFAGQVDRSLSYAVERMTGLRVSAGIAQDSEFRAAQNRFLSTEGPSARYLEAASSWVLVRTITRWMESVHPVDARLTRVHDFYWLRIWHRRREESGVPSPDAIEDLLATVGNGSVRNGRTAE